MKTLTSLCFNLRIESLVIERKGLKAQQTRLRCFNLRIESLVIESALPCWQAQRVGGVSISELRVLLLRASLNPQDKLHKRRFNLRIESLVIESWNKSVWRPLADIPFQSQN